MLWMQVRREESLIQSTCLPNTSFLLLLSLQFMALTDGIPRHPPGESRGNAGVPGVNFPFRITLNCSASAAGLTLLRPYGL